MLEIILISKTACALVTLRNDEIAGGKAFERVKIETKFADDPDTISLEYPHVTEEGVIDGVSETEILRTYRHAWD